MSFLCELLIIHRGTISVDNMETQPTWNIVFVTLVPASDLLICVPQAQWVSEMRWRTLEAIWLPGTDSTYASEIMTV